MVLMLNRKNVRNKFTVPGGETVLSREEGIVISITGLLDGKPLHASWQAVPISSILEEKSRKKR